MKKLIVNIIFLGMLSLGTSKVFGQDLSLGYGIDWKKYRSISRGELCAEGVLTPFQVKMNCVNANPLEKTVKEHSALKAMVYSALLPGAGQFYNEQYWKIPVIYVGGGVLAYNVIKNHRAMKEALDTDSPERTNDSESFRKQRDISIIGLVGVYALNVLDANIEGKLKALELNEDVTMKVRPLVKYSSRGGVSAGMKLKFLLQ